MNNLEKFNHSVSILVKAYSNGTLNRMDCTACAVGNLIVGNGIDLRRTQSKWHNYIHMNFCLDSGDYFTAIQQIEITGYTADQLGSIEKAFMNGSEVDFDMWSSERNFEGLMAVVDVLAEIHNIDLTVKDEAKVLFTLAK